MRCIIRRIGFAFLLTSSLGLVGGCSGGRTNEIKVEGKLLKSGAKYTPPDGQLLTITFYGLEVEDASGKIVKNGEPFQADLDPDGESFTVPGRDGYGIPPGKYRISITQRMTREAFDAARGKLKAGRPKVDRETDFLDYKFSPATSPIVREFKQSSAIVIDMDRPTEGASAG